VAALNPCQQSISVLGRIVGQHGVGNDAQAQLEYAEAAKLYDQLDDVKKDVELSWRAASPELADAYMQVTSNPLSLADPSNQDRLGPDDDRKSFSGPNAAVCAYTDTLDGKSTNRYFYRVMLFDGAQNRGLTGNPTPPVCLPKVARPKKPVIAKAVGNGRTITVQWVPCRDASVVEYRIYRAADRSLAADVRSMDLVATILISPTNTASIGQWKDLDPPLQTNVYYRIAALDADANPSLPSSPTSGRAFDNSFPDPPVRNAPVLQADVPRAREPPRISRAAECGDG
jgi:hypothetical protein